MKQRGESALQSMDQRSQSALGDTQQRSHLMLGACSLTLEHSAVSKQSQGKSVLAPA